MIDLPSSGSDAARLGDLSADADVARRALDTSGTGVVLVGHSGGGAVLTEVADHPSVVHSVYLAAFWPQRGQSVAEMLGGLPDWVAVDDGTAEVSHDLDLVRRTLCADIDMQTFAARVYPRYVLTSLASLGAPNTRPHTRHHIHHHRDHRAGHGRPPQAQQTMSAAADRVVRIPSSHSPMLSMPARLASLLGEAATAI